MQLFKINVIDKTLTLVIGMKGVALLGGLGNLVMNGQPTNEMKTIQNNTLIIIHGFNNQTDAVVLNCIKNLDNYYVEVPYKFILDNCVMDSSNTNTSINAVRVKYYLQNVLDKDTAIFIIVMTLTYISGLIIGKCF